MDSFEHVIATILQRDGYWTQTTFKVELTREDKAAIGRRSSPRWEIDIVAYRPGDNRLLVVECKSFLDSPGVGRRGFGPEGKSLKLFREPELRRVVFKRLVQQLTASNAIRPGAEPQLCLAAGRMVAKHREWVQQHFDEHGWRLITPEEIKRRLTELADTSYENAIASVVAKLLIR